MFTGDKVKRIVTAANTKGALMDILEDFKKRGKFTYLEELLLESPMTLKTAKLINAEIIKVENEKNLSHMEAAKALEIDVLTYVKIMNILKRNTEIF